MFTIQAGLPSKHMIGSVASSTRSAKPKLFAGLDDRTLREIFNLGRIRRLPAGKNIVVADGRPDQLFLLRRGRSRFYNQTESGSEVLLLWLVPGDVIGLISLLANPPAYVVNAATVTECEFLVWDRTTLRQLAKTYPQLMENGLQLALHYLGVYVKRHTGIVTERAKSRLAQTLHHLATEAGEVQPSGVTIDITNEQLSSLADISPFTASRLLSKWERDGKLRKRRGRVTLCAPESLMVP